MYTLYRQAHHSLEVLARLNLQLNLKDIKGTQEDAIIKQTSQDVKARILTRQLFRKKDEYQLHSLRKMPEMPEIIEDI